MFNGINKVILVGYLGADPEVISFSNKKSFIRVNIATSSSWKNNQTQEWVKRVEWHQVLFYNKWISIVEKYLKKGSKIYVEGFLRTDKFEKNGSFVFSTKVVCVNLLLLDAKSDNEVINEEFSENVNSFDKEEEIKKDIDDIPF